MDDETQQHAEHDDAGQISDGSDDPEVLAEAISEAARSAGRRVAVVESLTGGLVSSDLAASHGSSEWFRGGVVAYDRTTKHGVLRVPDGPVVADPAVRAMAESASSMFDADLVVALSGADRGLPEQVEPRPGHDGGVGTGAQQGGLEPVGRGDDGAELGVQTRGGGTAADRMDRAQAAAHRLFLGFLARWVRRTDGRSLLAPGSTLAPAFPPVSRPWPRVGSAPR